MNIVGKWVFDLRRSVWGSTVTAVVLEDQLFEFRDDGTYSESNPGILEARGTYEVAGRSVTTTWTHLFDMPLDLSPDEPFELSADGETMTHTRVEDGRTLKRVLVRAEIREIEPPRKSDTDARYRVMFVDPENKKEFLPTEMETDNLPKIGDFFQVDGVDFHVKWVHQVGSRNVTPMTVVVSTRGYQIA